MTWFQSTRATEATCPRCRAPILTALDEGVPATVDATPLPDRAAEIAVLLDGRKTYSHAQKQIFYRNATRIRDTTINGTIHAEHRCAGPQQTLLDELDGWK